MADLTAQSESVCSSASEERPPNFEAFKCGICENYRIVDINENESDTLHLPDEAFLCSSCRRNVKLQDDILILLDKIKQREVINALQGGCNERKGGELHPSGESSPVGPFERPALAISPDWSTVVRNKPPARRSKRASLPLFSPLKETPLHLMNRFSPLNSDVPAPSCSVAPSNGPAHSRRPLLSSFNAPRRFTAPPRADAEAPGQLMQDRTRSWRRVWR